MENSLAVVLERQDNHNKEITNLKDEVSRLKDDLQNTKIQQIKDNEKITTLFSAFAEIKEYIREINDKMDNKKDSFKDAVYKLAFDVTKLAMMGGLGYYFLNMASQK